MAERIYGPLTSVFPLNLLASFWLMEERPTFRCCFGNGLCHLLSLIFTLPVIFSRVAQRRDRNGKQRMAVQAESIAGLNPSKTY